MEWPVLKDCWKSKTWNIKILQCLCLFTLVSDIIIITYLCYLLWECVYTQNCVVLCKPFNIILGQFSVWFHYTNALFINMNGQLIFFFSRPNAAIGSVSISNKISSFVLLSYGKMEPNTVPSTHSQQTQRSTLNDDVSHNQFIVGDENNDTGPEVKFILVAITLIVGAYLLLIVVLWHCLQNLNR